MFYRLLLVFFFQAEDGIRDYKVTGVQTCALPISVVKIGGIARLDSVDVLLDESLVYDAPGRHHDIHLLLESHDAEHVAWLEEIYHISASALGVLQRLAFHRSGPVDHQAEVQRHTPAHLSTGRFEQQQKMLAAGIAREGEPITRHRLKLQRPHRRAHSRAHG